MQANEIYLLPLLCELALKDLPGMSPMPETPQRTGK